MVIRWLFLEIWHKSSKFAKLSVYTTLWISRFKQKLQIYEYLLMLWLWISFPSVINNCFVHAYTKSMTYFHSFAWWCHMTLNFKLSHIWWLTMLSGYFLLKTKVYNFVNLTTVNQKKWKEKETWKFAKVFTFSLISCKVNNLTNRPNQMSCSLA